MTKRAPYVTSPNLTFDPTPYIDLTGSILANISFFYSSLVNDLGGALTLHDGPWLQLIGNESDKKINRIFPRNIRGMDIEATSLANLTIEVSRALDLMLISDASLISLDIILEGTIVSNKFWTKLSLCRADGPIFLPEDITSTTDVSDLTRYQVGFNSLGQSIENKSIWEGASANYSLGPSGIYNPKQVQNYPSLLENNFIG